MTELSFVKCSGKGESVASMCANKGTSILLQKRGEKSLLYE